MAIDIVKINTAMDIRNGSVVVHSGSATGLSILNMGYKESYYANAKTTPVIEDIEEKYDNRFDDPSYYYGIGDSEVLGV